MKKNYSLLFIALLISTLTFGQEMPIDFSDSNDNFTVFGGTTFAMRPDPDDTSNMVGEFFNSGAQWQGFFIDPSPAVDLDERQEITLRFYAFDGNSHDVMIKLENGSNPNVEVQVNAPTQGSAAWQNLSFDFTNAQFSDGSGATNATGQYDRLTIFIDGVSTVPGTFLIDDIWDGTTPTDPHELDVIYTDLVWSDEFDVDGPVNSDNWYHQTFGPNGGQWFNGELQHYTDSQTNSFVSGGFLNIVAKRETTTQDGVTLDFTSARLNSKFAFTYGRVDVRARLPFGEGTWPAIWTLGKNINEEGAWFETQGFGTTPWPACGEIDIMEHGLHATNEVSSAIHTPSSSGATVNTDTQMLADVANDFHVYSVNWSPDRITFLIDDVGYYTYEPDAYNADTWPFDLDQFLLLNVAMGGIAGNVDAGFSESAMVIDYVRVYQNVLSTDDVFASKFSVYPNPNNESDVLNIQTTETIDTLELFNMVGQRILNQTGNRNQLDIQNVRSGIYVLKIYSGNRSITKRVIIQ
jgi:beta-glucanase (GH16 family)